MGDCSMAQATCVKQVTEDTSTGKMRNRARVRARAHAHAYDKQPASKFEMDVMRHCFQ